MKKEETKKPVRRGRPAKKIVDIKEAVKKESRDLSKMKEATQESINIIKREDGFAFLELCIPTMDLEKYLKWKDGKHQIEGVSYLMTECNLATLSAFMDTLDMIKGQLLERAPELMFRDLLEGKGKEVDELKW